MSPESVERSLLTAALDDETAKCGDVISAMDRLCRRLGVYFMRWIGAASWQSLLDRALIDVAGDLPSALSFGSKTQLRWNGEGTTLEVRDACIQVLVALFGQLGRMIGGEMALYLTERGLGEEDQAEHEGTDDG